MDLVLISGIFLSIDDSRGEEVGALRFLGMTFLDEVTLLTRLRLAVHSSYP